VGYYLSPLCGCEFTTKFPATACDFVAAEIPVSFAREFAPFDPDSRRQVLLSISFQLILTLQLSCRAKIALGHLQQIHFS
jgi:hypothetical protein